MERQFIIHTDGEGSCAQHDTGGPLGEAPELSPEGEGRTVGMGGWCESFQGLWGCPRLSGPWTHSDESRCPVTWSVRAQKRGSWGKGVGLVGYTLD